MRVIPCCPSLIRMVASMRYFAVRTICGLRRLAEALRRADSAPTEIASGSTAVRAIAGIPVLARSVLHRPEQAFIETPASRRERPTVVSYWRQQ